MAHLEDCECSCVSNEHDANVILIHSIGQLGAGAVTNVNKHGWRDIFWIQAAFHGVTVLMLIFFYHPPRRTDYPKMTIKEIIWSCDPIGAIIFVSGATLTLLALDWTGGTYEWHDAHVIAPLVVGIVLLIGFGLYGKTSHHRFESMGLLNRTEWKGRPDGIVAHVRKTDPHRFCRSI